MKINKLATKLFLATTALVLGACGGSNGEETANNDEIVTELPEETTVTFWHAMNNAQEEALIKLTDDFMAENENIKIELQNQSSYGDMQAKINSTLPSPKDLPTITQAYPGWLWNAAQDEMLVDLQPYMDDATIGWGDQEEIIPSLLEGATINDTLYGIPFNKSTEMLFYNVGMLEEYGVDVPTNFDELKEASQTIYDKSNGSVVGVGFDSLNNYYAIGMKNKGISFNKDIALDSEESKEVINYYADGVRDGYFRIAGSDGYMSGPFANEQVAMFIGSIAGEGYVKADTEGKFDYEVVARPEAINLQQGTDIYMFNSATAEERTAAFTYMKFLAEAENQLYWANMTGYMPILESVVNSDEYKNSTETKVPAHLSEATKELFAIPVEENTDPAYNEMRAIMENILVNTDKDIDELIQNSIPQLEDVWNQ